MAEEAIRKDDGVENGRLTVEALLLPDDLDGAPTEASSWPRASRHVSDGFADTRPAYRPAVR